MGSQDWKRKVPGVQWDDVWAWLEELRDEYGLWGHIQLHPPLPCRRGKSHGHLVLKLQRYLDGGKVREQIHQVELPNPARASAADAALQLVARVQQRLDQEVYEAERAAGEGALLL